MTSQLRILATLVVALGAPTAGRLAAQAPRIIPPHSSRLFAPPDTASAAASGDFHREGGLIGGASVGILGALVGYGVCADSDTHHGSCVGNALGLGLAGAVVGWVTGSLIGGLIPKGP